MRITLPVLPAGGYAQGRVCPITIMSYESLTYETILTKAKELYPELCFSSDLDNLCRVQVALHRLAKCDDLTPDELWKVNVLLPNVDECLQ